MHNTKNFQPNFEGNDLTDYNNFLIECLQKDYGDLGIHKHHILPKFMGGKNNSENLIKLSYQDHIKAHLILADCFPKGSNERIKNTISAQHILSYLILDEEHPENLDLAKRIDTSGENNIQFGRDKSGSLNPFYGKHHTEETKAIIREKRKLQIFSEESIQKMCDHLRSLPNTQSGEANPYYGLTFDERFGVEKSTLIRKKLKQRIKEREETKILPDYIFRCDEIINGKIKKFYRLCPNSKCGNKIYYGGRPQNLYNLKMAYISGTFCLQCRMNIRYQK